MHCGQNGYGSTSKLDDSQGLIITTQSAPTVSIFVVMFFSRDDLEVPN